ncbi:hypothetical protein Poli38472_004338 [Pythium oligandrum]|uniref:CMGC/CDK protein kinase n=1 Tax=Pythium oligandrum TaxID=41045 RepID=A0A8K1CA42_PYTOL|nr:hypothetical protein Poli38472_004338 [Pythium oligandrum]|eukprot:TMW59269.1 hypothetical protein Poli38472_004338 [Pythium oligandrum]
MDVDSTPSTAPDDAGLSFEHLEAIRNVQLITRNEYPLPHLTREKLHKADDAYAVCYCTYPRPDEPEQSRCDDVSCLNFATYIECSPSKCDAGKFCQNQRLQHPERFPALEAFKTLEKGYGVRTRAAITQGDVIGEYVGEIIDQKELALRLKSVPRNELNFYYLALEPGVYIDARNKGSFTRFVNHSCEPNCKTEKWTVKGEIRIAVVALRDIEVEEELTFDYQWKSLGSRRIKCCCGSANCKGVIGSEAVAKVELPQGYFRDPKPEEIGSLLEGRRIRLFLSTADTSLFAHAWVKRYVPEDETYELDYEDGSSQTPEDAFDSPSSSGAADELRSQLLIKLSERSWQLYIEPQDFEGEASGTGVFSIPKRRPSGTTENGEGEPASSTNGDKSDGAGLTTSPSQSSGASPSSYSFAARTLVITERRNQDGELVDEFGDIITTKILVKGIPPHYDERKLRGLFVAKPERSSSSLLAQFQRPRLLSEDIVVSLDMFPFDETCRWALVEFTDAKYPSLFKKNLNARNLAHTALRVYHAGRKEIDNFNRAKRHAAIKKREEAAAKDRQENDETKAQVKPLPYSYGRPLNWLVSIEQVENSPSRRQGMPQHVEDALRSKYTKAILRVARQLHLEREDATSAILALHRYFSFHPIVSGNAENMAAGMLHIYLKAHARKFTWAEFVCEAYAARYTSTGGNAKLDQKSDAFKRAAKQILETEKTLLDGLHFDISSADPYGLLESLTMPTKQKPKDASSMEKVEVPAEVQKEAKHMMSEVLRLSVWAHNIVECVVLSLFYVTTAALVAVDAEEMREEDVWTPALSIPAFLPRVDPIGNEKESLALLECALAITDALKEKWVRMDKQAKAARSRDRARSNPDEFDTERFAVQRHKPMEITQRITTVLKRWIGSDRTPSSSPSTQMDVQEAVDSASTKVAEFITFSMLQNNQTEGKFDTNSVDTYPGAGVYFQNSTTRKPGSFKPNDATQSLRLVTNQVENVDQIRKRVYLGTISRDVNAECVGQEVYLQPFPYRDHEDVVTDHTGFSRSCAREILTALVLFARSPRHFIRPVGIVFPADDDNATSTSKTEDGKSASLSVADLAMSDFMDDGEGGVSRRCRLHPSTHYLAFEKPLNVFSGLLESKISIPAHLRKRAIFDMIQSLAICHDRRYVHRYVAPCHLFVFQDGVRLGGCHAARKLGLRAKGDAYEMSESEYREHRSGSWIQVSAPEILLGDRQYTSRCDVWSAGCVALSILVDQIPLLLGSDLKSQLNLIFRLCGTPNIVWERGASLPSYEKYKPKHDYKMRLRKTIQEHRQEKKLDHVDDDAVDLLEAMLQLDPTKRRSAKKLLQMPYFAEFNDTSRSSAVDFAQLPSTYSSQRRRFEQQMTKSSSSSSKRRRPSESSGERRSSSGDNGKHRRHHSSSKRPKDDVSMTDDVPLPSALQHVAGVSLDSAAGDHTSSSSAKRAKLGWGMGLNSSG